MAVTLYRKNANADLTKLLRFFPATVELPRFRPPKFMPIEGRDSVPSPSTGLAASPQVDHSRY